MSTPASAWSKTNVWAREFACDVRVGLTKPRKELHSKYLYDELGSALFDAITYLPEYGLTRADARLLQQHSPAIVELSGARALVELGSGAGTKTRHVLRAMGSSLRYFPIDVSRDALARCERDLADLATVYPFEQSYLPGLTAAVSERRNGEPLLVLFLGSTIGNFERPCALEFLREVRARLSAGDSLLLGADLVKNRDRMLAAYDDPTGLTAAFNLNLLGRVNRELGGNFDLRQFEHEARWNEQERRIEMHLRSRTDQSVTIREAELTIDFRAGETIWTESSHKFQLAELAAMAGQTGFRAAAHWADAEWPFVESLWMVP